MARELKEKKKKKKELKATKKRPKLKLSIYAVVESNGETSLHLQPCELLKVNYLIY